MVFLCNRLSNISCASQNGLRIRRITFSVTFPYSLKAPPSPQPLTFASIEWYFCPPPEEQAGNCTFSATFFPLISDIISKHLVPTAELSLNNTEGYLLSPLGQGVRSITPLLNITRVWCAVGDVGGLSRAFAIARSYATVRQVGSPADRRYLEDIPLHMTVLAKIGVTYQALAHFTFGVVALLGKSECKTASVEEVARLRLLTPVLKAFVAERSVHAMIECMTCLGGQGYMEETGIARYGFFFFGNKMIRL